VQDTGPFTGGAGGIKEGYEMNPKTLEDMIAHVKKYPGWTMYPPDIDAIGNRVEIAKEIAAATGTILEWNASGSPRFMPIDYRQRMDIKAGWESCDLDSKDYGAPREGMK
jgi:hypothetical protein